MGTLKTWESADKTVRKDVIRGGEFTRKPTERSSCDIIVENVSVTGASLEDLAQKFNSELVDGTRVKSFIVGDANSEIDRRLERAIQMMAVSEKCSVSVLVSSETIGQPVCLRCELTLTGLKRFKPIWEWSPKEKYSIALKYKEDGARLYKEHRCVDAFSKFSKACKLLVTLEPMRVLRVEEKLETDIKNLRLVLYNNMAMCQLNRKNFWHAISLCNKVLEKDESNVKALYRRGVANGNLRNLEEAVRDLGAALSLEPTNHAVSEKLSVFNGQHLEATKKFDKMVKRMFQTWNNNG